MTFRMRLLRPALALLLALIPGSVFAQADPVVSRIIELGRSDNRVMEHADILTNRFGDRLTGSDNYNSAAVWAVNTMRSWGMIAELQEAGEMPVGFNRGPFSGKMLVPAEKALDFGTPAYTAGTKGKQRGHVVIAPVSATEFWEMRKHFRGAWVLIEGENSGWPRDRAGEGEMTRLLREAGALGTIQLSKSPIRLLYQRVASWEELPLLPDIKLADSQYNEIKNLVSKGERVELEFDIRNYFRPGPVKYHNVIAWIPGSRFPDEYVILGGHLDGLAGATAAVDNASGATPAMEAARLILAAGGKPDRTIMVHLWAAEEFGLLGSSAWVAGNPDKLPRISAVFNRDGGTNCISGLSVPPAMFNDFKKIVQPVLGLNPKYPFELTERSRPVRKGGRGGTDTWPFLQKGVPAFGFSTKGEHQYGRTWHTDADTYNEIIPEYQEYSALVTAVVAYGVANLGQQLSRDGFFMPEGIYADFSTNRGRISVLLDHKNAPMTVANFIGLAEGSISNKTYPPGKPFFNGSIWHRVVKGHVIQAGEPAVVKDPANQEESSTGYEIPNEISPLRHSKAGMIGMANAGPHTNTCQFYITLADRSYLDGNYTLFGEVVDGMDVVNKIEQGDTIHSVTIARAGSEAESFLVNDDIFMRLVENQWRKVKREKQERKDFESKFITDKYPGLTSTESGLKYKVLKEGSGPAPADSSILSVSYTGTLIGGDSFVSTSDGGKPDYGTKAEVFKWKAGRRGVIKGLQESLMSMKEGEKRLLVIPPSLGYGEMSGFYGKSVPGKKRFVISPGQTLILEVSLDRISAK